jgi:hypothetical protein
VRADNSGPATLARQPAGPLSRVRALPALLVPALLVPALLVLGIALVALALPGLVLLVYPEFVIDGFPVA